MKPEVRAELIERCNNIRQTLQSNPEIYDTLSDLEKSIADIVLGNYTITKKLIHQSERKEARNHPIAFKATLSEKEKLERMVEQSDMSSVSELIRDKLFE